MKNKFRFLFWVFAALCFMVSANANEHFDSAQMATLIKQRLSYMKDVAGYKAQQHKAIEDLAQEKRVLEQSVIDAQSLGIDGDSVKPFIQAQMDAAKAIQYRYRADWLSIPETSWVPLPLNEVRSKISKLSYEILEKLSVIIKKQGSLTEQDKKIFMDIVKENNLTNSDSEKIWKALKEIKLK